MFLDFEKNVKKRVYSFTCYLITHIYCKSLPVIVLSHWPHVATHVATQVAQQCRGGSACLGSKCLGANVISSMSAGQYWIGTGPSVFN